MKIPFAPIRRITTEERRVVEPIYVEHWVTMDDVEALCTAVSVALYAIKDDSEII